MEGITTFFFKMNEMALNLTNWFVLISTQSDKYGSADSRTITVNLVFFKSVACMGDKILLE
jgi:hypothetical protein